MASCLTKAVLAKMQKDMKQYANRYRPKVVEYKVKDLVLLSTKDLKWQMVGQHLEKLTKRFIGLYRVKAIISSNVVELDLPAMVKIHPVVNVNKIYKYSSQVEGQWKEMP